MFWKKREGSNQEQEKAAKPGRPKDLPYPIGRYLVVDLNKNPDWVWSLKCVMLEKNESKLFDIRVFDVAKANNAQVQVRDYTSLDNHPEMILFEGWFNKKTNQFEIHPPQAHRAA
jgi:hypothetical protein